MHCLDESDWRVIEAIQHGLPLVSRPYLAIGARVGLSETEVIARITHLRDCGIIKRFGVVVRHRRLGYQANAMVVWDVPDAEVSGLGLRLREFEFVTLCYRRPRHLPDWPYNLFTMIHGQDRNQVLAKVAQMVDDCGLQQVPHSVLFSRRCFKQCGALYVRRTPLALPHAAGAC